MKTRQRYDIEKCSKFWLRGRLTWRALLATVQL